MNNRFSIVSIVGFVALLTMIVMVSGFKIVTTKELAEIRNAGNTSSVDGATLLHDKIIPWANANAHDIATIVSSINKEGLEETCKKYGVQTSQAFPCSFWVKVSGIVTDVNNKSRVGKIVLSYATRHEATILTGPVIPGTALRDGYPDITYSDFDDQNDFASLSDKINKEDVSIIAKVGEISVGNHLNIVGAYATWDGQEPSPQIVPIAIEREGGK